MAAKITVKVVSKGIELGGTYIPSGSIYGKDITGEMFCIKDRSIYFDKEFGMGIAICRKVGTDWQEQVEYCSYLVNSVIETYHSKYYEYLCLKGSGVRKKTDKDLGFEDYKSMMKHSTRKKKKQESGIPDNPRSMSQKLSYRGYTDESHWVGVVGSLIASSRTF